jgi:hypothetical protein
MIEYSAVVTGDYKYANPAITAALRSVNPPLRFTASAGLNLFVLRISQLNTHDPPARHNSRNKYFWVPHTPASRLGFLFLRYFNSRPTPAP